jgi:hypothetical protein
VIVATPGWEERLWQGLEEGQAFFMGAGRINDAARALAATLEEAGIPYAIAGALALNAHGYERFTNDVDLIVTREGLAKLKELVLGRGYVEKFPGSKGMRDTVRNVGIDVLITGEYPGDGLPKPVAFPDPSVAERGALGRIVPLATLLELKLASGMTAPHRLRDLADVIELVRARSLPASTADALSPYVRAKFLELHAAASSAPADE